jgi:hypothetical protein
MTNRNVARIYREAVASYGPSGADRQEAFASAYATILNEIRNKRMVIDLEAAIRSELVKADESDGRAADGVLRRAATGDAPIVPADLDVIVTLGKGKRKQWADVSADDLAEMHDIRYQNYRAAKTSYEEFREMYYTLRPVLFQHKTFGAAFEAGGFPPTPATSAASAA